MHARRLAASLIALLMVGLPGIAIAHADLTSSDPADGSTLDTAPTHVRLTFRGELNPDGSGFAVTDGRGAEVGRGELDLDVAERNVLSGAVSISGDGRYEVAWTAVSIDGHAEEGTVSFSVGRPDPPDTALPRPSPLAPVGLVLLIIGAAAARRTRRPGRLPR